MSPQVRRQGLSIGRTLELATDADYRTLMIFAIPIAIDVADHVDELKVDAKRKYLNLTRQ